MKKRISHLQRIQQSKLAKWKNLDLLYEFEMDFVVEHINKTIDSYIAENKLQEGDYLPRSVVIEAYQQQDLIIVLKEQLIKKPEFWHIGIDSHFYNPELDKVHTIPFSIDIPAMNYHQLMEGCDIKVAIVDGLKTIKGEWKGLQKEMIANWVRQGIPEGYELIQSQVKIVAQAHYMNQDCFDRFEKLAAYREKGLLIKFLEQLESKVA
jgi:hypothetical protein